jgi:7-carboxy-7-deazaguanine synthase
MNSLPVADASYPLAGGPGDGVFATVQGEGSLSGLPMVFVRLAGCTVGCPSCDTDYRVRSRATAPEIAARVAALMTPATRWAWVTGGEPTDHDLGPLFAALHAVKGLSVALATAGTRAVDWPPPATGLAPDFLSVSPHSLAGWVQRTGNEVKLVFGLNGLRPDPALADACGFFGHKFVSPEVSRSGVADAAAVRECVEWVQGRPAWRMDAQSHKLWSIA